MIRKLTKQQEARFPEFVQKWIAIGLSTERADRARAELAIKNLYSLAKQKEPKVFWVPCPLSGALSAVVFARLTNTKAVESAVGSAVRSAGYSFWGGSLWAGYTAWADYFGEVCSIEIDRNYLHYTQSCGYAWLLNGVVFACERPKAIHRDTQGRLHCESGQAIDFESGWGLSAWHGVVVPRSIIDSPEKITADQAIKEQNAEIRRVMIERMGQERFLHESGAQKVHSDDFGALYKIGTKAGDTLDFVKVVNSTPEPDGSFKKYVLRVPPGIQTAKAAVAWTFDIPEDEYTLTAQS